MKNLIKKASESGVLMFLFMSACALLGVADGAVMAADAVALPKGGNVDTNAMTQVTDMEERSDDLILAELDDRVTKIRPHDVILDTISRTIDDQKILGDGERGARSQEVEHYAISVIDMSTTVKTAITDTAADQVKLETYDKDVFASEQTIIVEGVKGYTPQGTEDPLRNLMLYVIGKDSDGHPLVVAINGKPKAGGDGTTIPAIPKGTVLTRAGRGGSETQIQTDPYSGVPTKRYQYLQKFMAQVEVSDLFERAKKEVKWTFTDQEEEAVFDMRRTMNVSFWRGVKWKIVQKNAHNKKAEDVYFTEGIWTQAGKEYSFESNPVTPESLVELMKHAFTGNNSSKRKTFIVGSDLLEALEKVEYTKTISVGSTVQAHGIEYTQIVSKFGRLLIAHDQTLDDMGWGDKGFILDVDFLRKWSFGWRVQDFDFRKSGQSDSDGRALIEICGLVLRNPDAHSRVSL